MGKRYSHLTLIQRSILDRMLAQRVKKTIIAKHLGVHVSTIYREIKCNSVKDKQLYKTVTYYCSYRANKKYLRRRDRLSKLEQDHELRAFVCSKLRGSWSPWQIEWQLKYHERHLPTITHETIYRYIYGHWALRKQFTPYLRRRRPTRIKHRSRKSRTMSDHHISKRSEAINNRKEFGHWECDLMLFSKGTKTNLITLVERQSRFLLAIKNDNKRARPTAIEIIKALTMIKKQVVSITFDQGTEFSDFELIKSCLNTDVYFCTPASPNEKGGIENRNGVLRTVYPRDHDMASVSQADIDSVLESINSRPMLCLDYESPKTVFNRQRGFSDDISQ